MPQFYMVKPGDTLSVIAAAQGTTVQSLMTLNQISDQNIIFPGQTLLVSVNGTFDGGDEQNVSSTVINGLLYVLITDNSSYSQGEPVNITLVKTNVSSTAKTLFYTTGQRFDFEAVRANGTVVWRWSDGRFFSQQTASVTLQPGENQVFTAAWDQRNRQGNQVIPQEITIRGYNSAVDLRNNFVGNKIQIVRGGTTAPPTVQPPAGCVPGVNLLVNSGFEVWPYPNSPPAGWQGVNVSRQELIRHTGVYSARLGTNPASSARLSQAVQALGGRIYRLAYWVREIPQIPPGSNFRFNVRMLFYNSSGQLVGTADPEYTAEIVPESFIQFSFTSGLTPRGTRSLEVRFIFTPGSGNNNALALDDIFLECIG